MCQEKLFKVPEKMLVRSMKFVDQSVNSHVSVTRVPRNLIVVTPSHLYIIFLSLPFPPWIALIVLIFLLFNATVSFGPVQEHIIMPNRILVSHPSRHLCSIVMFITSSEGCLCQIDMKTLQ